MTNTNVLKGIRCPECNSTESFDIAGEALFLNVTDDGCTEFRGMAWSGENTIKCRACKHAGMTKAFTTQTRFFVAIQNVDIPLLRKQRDHLLTLPEAEETTGLVNLLDDMLDFAEGHK